MNFASISLLSISLFSIVKLRALRMVNLEAKLSFLGLLPNLQRAFEPTGQRKALFLRKTWPWGLIWDSF